PVTSTATGTAGFPTRLLPPTPPPFPYTTLFRSAQQPAVQLQDANGNPVSQSNVVVTATPSPAGATASSNTATTGTTGAATFSGRSEEHTSELQSLAYVVCRLTPDRTGPIALSAG